MVGKLEVAEAGIDITLAEVATTADASNDASDVVVDYLSEPLFLIGDALQSFGEFRKEFGKLLDLAAHK